MSTLTLFIMTANFTSQEILVVIHSKFAAKEYQPKEEDKNPQRPPADKLAEACWNGMLNERLPEISISKDRKPLPLWEIGEGRHLLYLKLGEKDEQPNAEWTINPYRFGEGMRYN